MNIRPLTVDEQDRILALAVAYVLEHIHRNVRGMERHLAELRLVVEPILREPKP